MDTRLTARRIVVAGLLAAITILLGVTQLGLIPVPTAAGSATIIHIPVIIGAILDGWLVGSILGLIFGILTFVTGQIPALKDPLVAVLPRIFIGITAALAYRGLRRWSEVAAVTVSAVVGTLTNTILVLGMAIVRGYVTFPVALGIGVVQGIPEAIVAAIIVGAVVLAWKGIAGRRKADL